MNVKKRLLLGVILMLLISTLACGNTQKTTPTEAASQPVLSENELVIATTPEMLAMMQEIATAFNQNHEVQVRFEAYSSKEMIELALKDNPPFYALNPDSALWFNKLSYQYNQANPGGDESLPIAIPRISNVMRFAISPVVLGVFQTKLAEVASPFHWKDLATTNLKWVHPSTNYVSGMVAVLAQFYSVTGTSRGLDSDLVNDTATLEKVKQIEETVLWYGTDEFSMLEKVKTDGIATIDALVLQESAILQWNSQNSEKLAAVYPFEGAAWADHPLALVERYANDGDIPVKVRDAYAAFTATLLSQPVQELVISHGFRPTQPMPISLMSYEPFASNGNSGLVDINQPQTTLQIPNYNTLQVVENIWAYIKKPANIVLVVDVSGSMDADGKLEKVKQALLAFIDNMVGINDRLMIVIYSADLYQYGSLDRQLDSAYREELKNYITSLQPQSSTAMIDAAAYSYEQLYQFVLNQPQQNMSNIVVLMTDGMENASLKSMRQVENEILTQQQVRINVFAVAFGKDADFSLLQQFAEWTQGQLWQDSTIDILEIYAIISQYF